MCSVPSMAVFCSSMIPRVPGLLLKDFLNDFDVVPIIIILFIIIIIIIISLIQRFCKARVTVITYPSIPLRFFSVALQPNAGHGLLILEVSRSHRTTHHSR